MCRSSRWRRCSERCSACLAPGYDVLAMVKPQFEVGRERVGKGGVVRDADDRRAALVAVGEAALSLGAAVLGYRSSGLPGPKGNRETFVWLADPQARRAAAAARCAELAASAASARAPGARGRAVREFTVLHPPPPRRHRRRRSRAGRAGRARRASTLRLDAEETRKHGLDEPAGSGARRAARRRTSSCASCSAATARSCTALRLYSGTRRARVRDQLRRDRLPRDGRAERASTRVCAARSRGDFELLRLPAIVLNSLQRGLGRMRRTPARRRCGTRRSAVNDVAIHRKVGERVAELAYEIEGEDVGSVRCDGLVVATRRARPATTSPTAAR